VSALWRHLTSVGRSGHIGRNRALGSDR
jgi:hypothetical protein